MKYNISCEVCNKVFDSTRNNAKYCSAECKVAGAIQKRKKWEADNPEYMKNKMKAYRDKQKRTIQTWKK